MRVGTITQQPTERKWYSIDYREALDADDRLSSVEAVAVDPPELTVVPVLPSDDRVRLQVSGGQDGATYKITVQVRTVSDELWEDELIARIKAV